MITIKTILCPVDFFPASDAAATYAAGLASHYDAKLHLLHVISPVIPNAYEFPLHTVDITKSLQETSTQDLRELQAKVVSQVGTNVQIDLSLGDVYDEIKRAIKVVKPELVVMGTHGRRGVERWCMGSTTEKLLRHTPVPLLTISAKEQRPMANPQFRRILVTTDFSDGAADALSYAFSIAEENESRITLLHVLPDGAADLYGRYRDPVIKGFQKKLDGFVPSEARTWCDVVTRVETGVPYRVILKTIEDEQIDLLVMNIHGKGMMDRALLGSNAERVVRAAVCPVMLIPPMKKRFKRRARPGGNHVAA